MTPKQHAKNLVKEYMDLFKSLNVKFVRNQIKECAKQSALIAVYQVEYTLWEEITDKQETEKLSFWYEQVRQNIKTL